MRHPEPEIVRVWKARPSMPECCHTCDHYDADGVCDVHKAEPPEDFAATDKACPAWAFIPF